MFVWDSLGIPVIVLLTVALLAGGGASVDNRGRKKQTA